MTSNELSSLNGAELLAKVKEARAILGITKHDRVTRVRNIFFGPETMDMRELIQREQDLYRVLLEADPEYLDFLNSVKS